MIRWFKHTVKLDIPLDKDGTTLRKQLEFVKKQIGDTPPELIPPCDLPPQAIKVWTIYSEGFMKFKMDKNPMSYQEMRAYCDLTGTTLAAWEVNALKSIDTAYISVLMEYE